MKKMPKTAKPELTTRGSSRFQQQPEDGGLTEEQKRAGMLATSPTVLAAAAMEPFQKNLIGKDATVDSILDGLLDRITKMQKGDLACVEAMLMAQAISLQTTSASLMRRAASQELLQQFQAFMTLGLKAQAQSRATLEALIELKLPRHAPTFVRQANIAHGPQQVNNGYQPSSGGEGVGTAPAHAEPSRVEPNKLLEASNEWVDTRAQEAAGRGNSAVEAVGAVHRPKN